MNGSVFRDIASCNLMQIVFRQNISSPLSWSENTLSKKPATIRVLLAVRTILAFSVGVNFDPENGDGILLRNAASLSPDYCSWSGQSGAHICGISYDVNIIFLWTGVSVAKLAVSCECNTSLLQLQLMARDVKEALPLLWTINIWLN
jgi:hypothetical protein